MAAQAVFEGTIPEEGVGALLGGLEEIGTTGLLTFESESGSGTVRLVQGQVAGAETTSDEEHALQVLLTLRNGEFAVYPFHAAPTPHAVAHSLCTRPPI